MKVNITKTGTLIVEAENDLEEYALNKWADENINTPQYFDSQEGEETPFKNLIITGQVPF